MELLQFDDVLSSRDFHEQAQYLQNANWKYSGQSDTNQIKFWFHDLIENDFYTKDFFSIIQQKLDFEVTLHRVYANGQTYGQPGYMHQDSEHANQLTFIFFANHVWMPEWGGQTIIKDEGHYASIMPVPNSGILFPGKLMHVGSEPTRHCPELRVTVAFKLYRKM